jgi:hypothetical protein
LEERVVQLEEELAFQAGNIEELELLQWRHEDRVVSLVQEELWQRANSCYYLGTGCYSTDLILYPFAELENADYRLEDIRQLITQGQWSAKKFSEAGWLIEARLDDQTPPIVYLADSMYRTICWEPLPQCN